jgi:hypothetical protein
MGKAMKSDISDPLPKSTYSTPKLEKLGNVVQLTQGGSGIASEKAQPINSRP